MAPPAPVSQASPTQTVLVVEDDPHSLELTASFVRESGARVVTAVSVPDALAHLERLGEEIVFVITDIKLREQSGLDLFRRLHADRPTLPIVLMTAYGSTDQAVAAMKEGAFYYFTKPVDFPMLLRIVQEALEKKSLATQLALAHARLDAKGAGSILGTSQALKVALDHAASVAELDTTVLLLGETGTGKELFAEYIHERSARRDRQMVALNCAALPEQLLESELFGHERGAFTGAVARKPGKFEVADGGTVFLDEVGDLAQSLQAKLLRVLETKQIEPVGAIHEKPVDVRIIAATNQDLSTRVAEGTFREDLFYRLEAFPIVLPPLRERQADIPILAVHFLERYARQHNKPIEGFEPPALDALQSYRWPGNVRELRQYVERSVILTKRNTVGVDHLPPRILQARTSPEPTRASGAPAPDGVAPGDRVIPRLRELEREAVLAVLRETGGNRSEAARRLGLTRNQIRYRLQKLDEE